MDMLGSKKNRLSASKVHTSIDEVRADKWFWKPNFLCDSEVDIFRNGEIFCHVVGRDFDVFVAVMRAAGIQLRRRI